MIQSVGEGGTLPAAHRKQMQAVALTPELAAQQRVASLLAKYCEGHELTPGQWEEIRTAHPGFAAIPAPPVAAVEVSSVAAPKLVKVDEQRYSALYRKGWRTIRRWIEKGEKAGDPCPLDDPRALLGWWPRHSKWPVPPGVEEAALASAKGVEPAASSDPVIPPASAPGPAMPVAKAIDLESFDPEEGDRLRELKQIQAAKFAQLKEALKVGDDCTLLESRYLRTCETIDKIESRVEARMQKRGLFILREAVMRELAEAAELLRQSHSSMDRRVQELCPSLSAEQRIEVSAAIARARRSEERILSMLPSLQQNDLLKELAA